MWDRGGYDDDGYLGTGAILVVYLLHKKSNIRNKISPTPPCPTFLTYPMINNDNKGNTVRNSTTGELTIGPIKYSRLG